MSFEAVCQSIRRQMVIAGMDRMTPDLRELVDQLLARFAARDARPLSIAEEAAAFALWGTDDPAPWLAWHLDIGGPARALELLIAAAAVERVQYEWDSSVWALRRARPLQGMDKVGPLPWIQLRAAIERASPPEREAALEIAHAPGHPWIVRAAIAFAFPTEDALWTEADDHALRHADIDFASRANVVFGVLAAMRRWPQSFASLRRAHLLTDTISPADIVDHLGDAAVGALRLVGALVELGQLGTDDAIRALAEFSDVAPAALVSLRPGEPAIRALAALFTTHRPRRTGGLHLARGLLAEMCVGAPESAERVAQDRDAAGVLVDGVLAGAGARLPADDWTSPWPGKKSPRRAAAAEVVALPAVTVPFTETLHGAPTGEVTPARSQEHDVTMERRLHGAMRTGPVYLFMLAQMTDAAALRLWSAIPRERWYGDASELRDLLVRFGLDLLPSVIEQAQTRPDMLRALADVESPRVAPVMARAFVELARHADTGKAWLERFPEAAVIGLAELTSSPTPRWRDIAIRALAHLASRRRSSVTLLLERAGIEFDLDRLKPSTKLPARKPTLPAFLDTAALPRPIRRDGEAALAPAAIAELLALAKATLPELHPTLDAIAARYTDDSLARMAWSVFRQWLFAGAPPKEKWAMYSVGRFPDDDNARALGRLAREWAPVGLSARAQLAVDALALMNTQTALVEIHDIARRAPSKAFKARAQKVFRAMAESLHLTEEELADRLVPDLSEQELTFGELRAELDIHLKPRLIDPAGDEHTSPPRGDGPRWNELKKLCTRAARSQIPRLERAMAEGRHMPLEHFTEIYLVHSLIRWVSRGLVWGAYRGGQLAFAFTVTADGCIDASGAACELPVDHDYGVVHPIELAEPARDAWQRRLPEQPFEQLARAVYPADDLADCQRRLAANEGVLVRTQVLLGMRARGWERGAAEQGGVYVSIERAGDGWSAAIEFAPGIYLGSPTDSALQQITRVDLRADAPPPLALLSDIQRDLALLTAE